MVTFSNPRVVLAVAASASSTKLAPKEEIVVLAGKLKVAKSVSKDAKLEAFCATSAAKAPDTAESSASVAYSPSRPAISLAIDELKTEYPVVAVMSICTDPDTRVGLFCTLVKSTESAVTPVRLPTPVNDPEKEPVRAANCPVGLSILMRNECF